MSMCVILVVNCQNELNKSQMRGWRDVAVLAAFAAMQTSQGLFLEYTC